MSSTFLGTMAPRVPYVIGVAGSVAVGKSTFARILQALLARWPDHPQVDLVTTDGFLHPNAVLAERGLMDRKGFPESYDTRRLLAFLRDLKSGAEEVRAPVYSHVVYDIVPGEEVDRAAARHPHPRGPQRAAGRRTGRRPPSSSATTSTSRSTSTPTRPTSASGTSSASWRCARRCSRTRTASSATSPTSTDEEAVATAEGIWDDDQRPQPAGEHPADPRAGVADPAQGRRPPRHRGPPAQAVTAGRALTVPRHPVRVRGRRGARRRRGRR